MERFFGLSWWDLGCQYRPLPHWWIVYTADIQVLYNWAYTGQGNVGPDSCDYLSSIYKDICSKQSKCINSWGRKQIILTSCLCVCVCVCEFQFTINQNGNILETIKYSMHIHSSFHCIPLQFFPWLSGVVKVVNIALSTTGFCAWQVYKT